MGAWRIEGRTPPSPAPLSAVTRRWLLSLERWMAARFREARSVRLDAADDAVLRAQAVIQYVAGPLTLPPGSGGPPSPPTPSVLAAALAGPAAVAESDALRAMRRAGMPPHVGRVRLGLVEDVPGAADTTGRLIGVQVLRTPAARTVVTEIAAEAASYIGSIPLLLRGEVESRMLAVVGEGWTWQRLQGELVDALGVSEARAELIARDQTAKVNGRITEDLHAAAGITHYIWRATRDQATRPVHRDADGQVVAWASPGWPGAGFYGEPAHAGQGGQCRCTAEPVPPSDWTADVEAA